MQNKLKNLETDTNTLLIDIRDIRELKKLGTIENSTHIPRKNVRILVRS